MRLKAAHPALSRGGMCFLFAEGRVLSMARFTEGQAGTNTVGADAHIGPTCRTAPTDEGGCGHPPLRDRGSGDRFGEAFVFVMSAEKEAREIRLPLGVLGAARPAADRDVFGTPLTWRPLDEHAITLTVPAHSAVLFRAE